MPSAVLPGTDSGSQNRAFRRCFPAPTPARKTAPSAVLPGTDSGSQNRAFGRCFPAPTPARKIAPSAVLPGTDSGSQNRAFGALRRFRGSFCSYGGGASAWMVGQKLVRARFLSYHPRCAPVKRGGVSVWIFCFR